MLVYFLKLIDDKFCRMLVLFLFLIFERQRRDVLKVEFKKL